MHGTTHFQWCIMNPVNCPEISLVEDHLAALSLKHISQSCSKGVRSVVVMILWRKLLLDPQFLHLFLYMKKAFTRRQSDVFMSHVLSEHQSKTQTYWIHDDTEHLKQKIIRSDRLQLECLSFFCLINDFNSYQLSIIHDVLFSADQQINYSF